MASPASALPDSIRRRCRIFDHTVYINSCSQGVLTDVVRDAYGSYLEHWETRGAPWDYWVEQTEAVRASFADLVNATADEIAVTTSLSAGLSSVLSGFEPGERNRIVVSDLEFPTVGQIAHAQELRGWEVIHVPASDDGTVTVEGFEAAIDERTALVATTYVCYCNGVRQPVDGIVRAARAQGALVFLDAYQATGAIPIDVRALDVDFLATGSLKYLLGSAGLGFLYARAELARTVLPTQTGWFADANIFEMDISDYSPASNARRFESGTPPIPAIYAGVAGIELMKEVGVAATETHVRNLNDRLISGLDELDARVVTPRDPTKRGPLIAVGSTDAELLVEKLAAARIVASSREGNLRLSAHCYNARDDIDEVIEALARHRDLLVPRS